MSPRLVPFLVVAMLIGATLLPMQAFGESQPPTVPDMGGNLVADANAQNGPDTDDRVCTSGGAGYARCHARVRTDHKLFGRLPMRAGMASSSKLPGIAALPAAAAIGNSGAYDPAYLQSAYNLTNASSTAGHGRTVAIVDAYDAPNAEADVNYYRSWFGLSACTTANGCFRKVNQTGAMGPYPAVDASWAQEVSLDLDMVSAICPNCNWSRPTRVALPTWAWQSIRRRHWARRRSATATALPSGTARPATGSPSTTTPAFR